MAEYEGGFYEPKKKEEAPEPPRRLSDYFMSDLGRALANIAADKKERQEKARQAAEPPKPGPGFIE